ncbi:tol-pal system protein YbgF [Thiolinea disciformis]|uniref:tol-pal system protein YbgF n=1 Tax=Thiolinea disciformis TaxID=125614 RepID=UPI0012FEBDA0|nr:tol-pal system protein YbgF [Thiolinea disciformis]
MLYTVNRSLWGVLATAMLLAPPSVKAITDDAAVQLLDRVNELEDEVKSLRDENERLRDKLQNQPTRTEELEKANAPLQGLDSPSTTSPALIDLDKLKPDLAKPESASSSTSSDIAKTDAANKGITTSSEPLKSSDATILLAPNTSTGLSSTNSAATTNTPTTQGVLNSSTGSTPQASTVAPAVTSPSTSGSVTTTTSTNTATTSSTTSSSTAGATSNSSEPSATPAAKVDPSSPDSYYFYGADKAKQPETAATTAATPATDTAKKETVTPTNLATPNPIPATEKPVVVNASKDTPSDMKAKTDYNEAYKLLVSNSQSAIPAFRAFLVNYPKHELAANAQYWLAEALFVQKDYEGASTEFMRVLREYQDSPKASAAALKLGYSYYELKQWDFARRTLEDTIRFFPDSSSAKLAQARLQRMKDEGR